MAPRQTGPVVDTANGPIRGIRRGAKLLNLAATPEQLIADAGAQPGAGEPKYMAFLGIPYARPPAGPLRFAEPQPLSPWEEPLDCTHYGPTPLRETPSGSLIPEPSFPGEGILNLNVFTPDVAPETPAPVMVYIHGGGYTSGSPSSPWYDGRSFNRDGVVTVSISYRLGFQGFGMIDGAVPNRGVLDWVAALEWVQQNINSFGGDPDDVTIAGQSAGGGAVLTLLGMPSAQRLFRKVWSISGVPADLSREVADDAARRVAEIAGIPPTVAGFESLSDDELAVAEEKFLADSMKDSSSVMRKDPQEILKFGPVIDGQLLTETALSAISNGIGADKHLLIGTTADEFTMMADQMPKLVNVLPKRLVLFALGLRGSAAKRYMAGRASATARETVGRYVTDALFRGPTLQVVKARGNAPTWLYSFEWVGPKQRWSIHCSDVPFWFDCLDQPYSNWFLGHPLPRALATQMHAAAVDFVVTGAPGWPRVKSEDPITMVIDGSSGGHLSSEAYAAEQELLHI